MKEREQSLNQQLKKTPSDNTESPVGIFLGLNLETMGGNIPGFNMIKDRVLKPMLVATEKVVEYYFKEDESP